MRKRITEAFERCNSTRISKSFNNNQMLGISKVFTVDVFELPKRWKCVACVRASAREHTRAYMHTYAEHIRAFTNIYAHAHKYARTNALRISQETDELSLNADSLSKGQRFSEQLESKPESPMRRVAVSKYITRERSSLVRGDSHRDLASSAPVISGSLGFPSERLSLTSVYTSPSLSLFRSRTAHQHAAGFLARAHGATGILVASRATLASLARGEREREIAIPGFSVW